MGKIEDSKIKDICKIGQGKDCCRYLVMGANGFECMKTHRAAKAIIDNHR